MEARNTTQSWRPAAPPSASSCGCSTGSSRRASTCATWRRDGVQILTATARRLYEAQRRRLPAVRRQAAASSFAEWTAAQEEIDAAKPEGRAGRRA